MKNTLFFEHLAKYLNHEQMLAMFNSPEGDKLLKLSENTSKCLHEDWKQNLINEKGPDYQHFRAVKDKKFTEIVLAHRKEFENIDENNLFETYQKLFLPVIKKQYPHLSEEEQNNLIFKHYGIDPNAPKKENPKKLFRIVPVEVKREEEQPDGSKKEITEIVEEVQFDLIRVPFEALTKKWQDANLDAAKFALCLVKKCVENGELEGTKEQIFEVFENMAHDVHIEWMEREHSWADVRLLFPYEHLLVKSETNNEKDKDRAQIVSISKELTFQPNILALNRSIVVRAIEELFKDKSIASGLNPAYLEKLISIKDLLEQQNKTDFARYANFKATFKSEVAPILKGKSELTFEDLEKCASIYYNHWRAQARTVGALPKEYNASYENLLADDERINFKNVARREIADLIKEMVKQKELDAGLEKGADIVLNGDPEKDEDKKSILDKKIKAQNKEDVANYVALTNSSSLQ